MSRRKHTREVFLDIVGGAAIVLVITVLATTAYVLA